MRRELSNREYFLWAAYKKWRAVEIERIRDMSEGQQTLFDDW